MRGVCTAGHVYMFRLSSPRIHPSHLRFLQSNPGHANKNTLEARSLNILVAIVESEPSWLKPFIWPSPE